MVNDNQVPPSHSKTYTQHDLDKPRTYWEEQFKLKKAIDNKNLDVKVTKNQTLGMLKSCDQDQICTIHRLVTFEPKSSGEEGINPDQTKQSHGNSIENETVTKDFYQIPTRNKHRKIEVLTVLKDNISTVKKSLIQLLMNLYLTQRLNYKMPLLIKRQSLT